MSLHCTNTGGKKKELAVGPCTADIQFLVRQGAIHLADAIEQLRFVHLFGQYISPFTHPPFDKTPDTKKQQFHFTSTVLLRCIP